MWVIVSEWLLRPNEWILASLLFLTGATIGALAGEKYDYDQNKQ